MRALHFLGFGLSFLVLAACSEGADVSRPSGSGSGQSQPPSAPAGASTPDTVTTGGGDGGGPASDGPTAGMAEMRSGVVFVHGTGDVDGPFTCTGAGDLYRCVVTAGIDYWGQDNLDVQRTRMDGTQRPYAVIGCPLGTQTPWPNPNPVKRTSGMAEEGSAVCVAKQIARFLAGPDGVAGNADDVPSVVVVTHSGGSNVLRYILAQYTKSSDFTRVQKATRKAIMVAAPSHGTYLANYMFTQGTLGNTVGTLASLFGSDFYDDDGVYFIQTDQMDAHNADRAKLVSLDRDISGVPTFMAGGVTTHYDPFDSDGSGTKCGGGNEAAALALLDTDFLSDNDPSTYRDACDDGFISCQSAMAMAGGDPSRILFGRLPDGTTKGHDGARDHNQSRKNCDDIPKELRDAINATTSLGFTDRKTHAWPHGHDSLGGERPWLRSSKRARFVRSEGAATLLARPSPFIMHEGRAADVELAWEGMTLERAAGVATSPGGAIEITSFERTSFAAGHMTFLPREAGAWRVAVELDGRDESGAPVHRTVDVGVAVVKPVATLGSMHLARDGEGAIVARVDVRAREPGRYGIHIVVEVDGEPRIAQASADLRAGNATLEVPLTDRGSLAAARSIAARELSLVAHDRAETVDRIGPSAALATWP